MAMNNSIEKINNILKLIILTSSVYYIFMFVFIAVSRMAYPFDLEWMEGGMVEHVFRLVSSQPIYTSPSLEFIPFIYTPLYFYLSAWVSELTGVGFFPLRLVSFLSTVSIIFFTYLIVKKETSNKPVAIISAGLFAATFGISGFWYDLARVDSLFLALFVISFYFLIRFDNKTSLIFSGIFASLSFLTKHTAIIFILPLFVYLIYDKKWQSIFYIFPFSLISAVVCVYMNWISHGWFYHWLVEIPAGHQLLYTKLISFWSADILQPLGLAFLTGAFFLYRKYVGGDKKKFVLYLTLVVGLLLCSWTSRIHLGGYDNVLIPAFWGIIVLFGLGLNDFLTMFANKENESNQFIKLFIFIAVIAQMSALYYNPILQIPDDEDYEYGKILVEKVKSIDGEVFIQNHQYISRYAGKESYSHIYVLYDYFHSNFKKGFNLKIQYDSVLQNRIYSAIITDDYFMIQELEEHYKLDTILFPNNNYFKCKTGGHKTRPEFVFIPK